ncbi:MAG: hypothetical protein WDA75_13605 [Candidatus Latescibacterota bacterium]|jgi:hypothetical protein
MKTIILLDLNYTLVSNSEKKKAPFIKQIEGEEYRKELIELVRPHTVLLITARPIKYEVSTIESLRTKTGWTPQFTAFNKYNLAPHLFKKKIVTEQIQIKFQDVVLIAIESNPKTIAEYKKLGILCLSVQ